jgi:exopolysaccharide biosynthesis predicted pyruvyltransferase EpsI
MLIEIYRSLAKVGHFEAQDKNCLMLRNYPDFKEIEIYTVHFSNLAYMLRMNMGVIEVNLEIFEFFGTQTIKDQENFNAFYCLGGGKC